MRCRVAVQRRTGTRGEASAAVIDTIRAGIPTIVSDAGSLRELPRDAVVHVPQEATGDELAARLRALLDDPAQRAALVTNGFALAERESFEHVAAAILNHVLHPNGRPVDRLTDR